MQGNWENWRNSFWWSANREFFLSENDFKRSSEIHKFSRENVDIFWWSANRGKICKVVRESEKVENRCSNVRYHNVTVGLIYTFQVKSNNFIFRDSNTIVYINQVTVTVHKTKSKSLNVTKCSRKRVRQNGESR